MNTLVPFAMPPSDNNRLAPYLLWARTRWVKALLPGTAAGLADVAVMGLGLCGECGEVLDVVEAARREELSEVRTTNALLKELGDVAYYWACISEHLNCPVAGPTVEARPPCAARDMELLLLEGSRLAGACAAVAEALKKFVRDAELDRTKLRAALARTVDQWAVVCHTAGFDWTEVLAANRAKVDDRAARGTARGSGDER
jgi:predicted nucleic acid-binding Zn ribbon protein